MRRYLQILGLLALCINQIDLSAQVYDAGLWAAFGLKKEWNKDFQSELEIENRFNENWAELETAFADLSTKYKISKHFDVALNYRFGNKRALDNTYSYRQRIALDLSADQDVWEFKLKYRARFQVNQRRLAFGENDIEFSNGWRNKLSADIKIFKKTELGASAELFTSQDEEGWKLSDVRYTTQLSYKLSKRKFVNLGFLFQRELQAANPLFDFVTTIGYSYELK